MNEGRETNAAILDGGEETLEVGVLDVDAESLR